VASVGIQILVIDHCALASSNSLRYTSAKVLLGFKWHFNRIFPQLYIAQLLGVLTRDMLIFLVDILF